MIEVSEPWGGVGLGNHFFMYTYVRLLSEKLNYKLVTPEYVFKEKTVSIPTSIYKFLDLDGIDNTGKEKFYFNDGITCNFSDIDESLNFFKEKDCHLISHGYHQRYDYWKKYKNEVKDFFKDFIEEGHREEDEVGIHLRTSYQDGNFKLPLEYYINSIESLSPKKICIFYDNIDRHSELMDVLKSKNKFEIELMNLNVPDSIREMGKFKKLICSQGSFSFWSAFLSRAEHIIWPITNFGPNRINGSRDINYVVDDESRYEFVTINK